MEKDIMYYVYWVSKISGAHMPGGICDTERRARKMADDLAKIHNTSSDIMPLSYNQLSVDEKIYKY